MGANRKKNIRAKELREQVVKELPAGRAKTMADFKSKLVNLEANVEAKARARDSVADERMDKLIKLMGFRAILPLEVKLRLGAQSDIPGSYMAVYKRVEGLCARRDSSLSTTLSWLR